MSDIITQQEIGVLIARVRTIVARYGAGNSELTQLRSHYTHLRAKIEPGEFALIEAELVRLEEDLAREGEGVTEVEDTEAEKQGFRRHPTNAERAKLEALERRIDYLERQTEAGETKGRRLDYARAELSALKWAVKNLNLWCEGFNERVISRVEKSEQPEETEEGGELKKSPQIHVRRFHDRRIVHSVDVNPPCSESRLEKIVRGILINTNTEEYFVDESEVEAAIKREAAA